jgi:2-oxoisovalerate ferredoxin oxidoreductase beta subunit
MSVIQAKGLYPVFERSGQPTRSTHYCAGCGHGILHKLIGEALVDLGIQDRTVIVNPIGCAVFGYYYWDVGSIGAAHGRAQAAGTALARVLPQAIIVAYQGDGDLGAIGFNCTFQAACRGENMATFFVNNANYGMTGGQMAPTTLIGQRTATSPRGRDAADTGYPLHVCEVLNQLRAPVYIERCSVADAPRIQKARRAVRKALEIQRDGGGYAFVEFLAPCPTSMAMDPVQAAHFVAGELENEFPLGCLRDASRERTGRSAAPPRLTAPDYFAGRAADPPLVAPGAAAATRSVRLKFSGFGGQGVLSLGICVAEAGRLAGLQTTWFPSYGPEQRGGAAACAVVMSGQPIGSPMVDHPDVLIGLNQPALDRYLHEVRPGGWVFYDSLVPLTAPAPPGVRMVPVPATEMATALGVPRVANTAILAVLFESGITDLPEVCVVRAIENGLRRKPALLEPNRRIFATARSWYREHSA